MKRIAAAIVAMILVLCCAAALAEKTTVFTDPVTGDKVTLEIENATIEFDEDSTEDLGIFTVKRDGVCDVYVLIYAKDTEDKNLNDMTDEELQGVIDYFTSEIDDEDTKVTLEVTKDGNKYVNIVSESENGSLQQRFTVFENFDMSRTQFSTGLFTEEDTAFLAEVQSGLWTEKAE